MHVVDDLSAKKNNAVLNEKKEFRGSPKVLLRLDNPWLMACISAHTGSISLFTPRDEQCTHHFLYSLKHLKAL